MDAGLDVRLSWPHVSGDFECVDITAPGGGLWSRKPRLTQEQVRAAWAHDVHHDGAFPSVQTIWMLSEFNGANGGTRLLRDTWRERRQPRREDRPRFVANCIPATGEPGDVLVYVGQTWHSEGVNTTQIERVGLLGAWNKANARRVTMRDHSPSGNDRMPDWGTPVEVLRDLPGEVARILGFHQNGSVMEGVGRLEDVEEYR